MEILKIIADNQKLQEAVRTVLMKQFMDTSSASDTLTDEQLGQFLRARIVGVKAVEDAFKEIERYKTVEQKNNLINPAR